MPAPVWLALMTLSQAFGLATSVALMPLLFSKIPGSKFGTVSSGFGIFGAASLYLLGNLGGTWVHVWSRGRTGADTQYTALWLLQALMGVLAVALAWRCLRAPLLAHPREERGG
jgi:MFS family permease